MKPVGPDTPVGTRCLFIGPTKGEHGKRCGTEVTILVHAHQIRPRAMLLQAKVFAGFIPDVVVRAESDGEEAFMVYSSLMRIEPDDELTAPERQEAVPA